MAALVMSVRLSRSPHGERGLKSSTTASTVSHAKSLSSRRAWIGITCLVIAHALHEVALLTESVD